MSLKVKSFDLSLPIYYYFIAIVYKWPKLARRSKVNIQHLPAAMYIIYNVCMSRSWEDNWGIEKLVQGFKAVCTYRS